MRMSKGQIIIESSDEPTVIDFDVQTDEQIITVTITPTSVQIHTKDEPHVRPT